MSKIRWFDSNLCVGRPMNAEWESPGSRKDLLRTMADHSVSEGLIWHVSQFEAEPYLGNDMLESWLDTKGGIMGCMALMPTLVDPPRHKDIFKYMKSCGFRAVRIFPSRNNYSVSAFKADSTMDEIVERRIPVIISLESGSTWDILAEFLKTFPKATCIASDHGVWGQDRYLWPLLEKYPGLHAETGMLSIEADGLLSGVEKFGASRFVFGSGYPRRYMGAPMADILHSEITDAEKAQIAGDNMRRLIGRIKL